MNNRLLAALCVAMTALVPATANAAALLDGSFEAQGAASGACQFNYGGSHCAAQTPWVGGGATSGLNFTSGLGATAPDGNAFAFIQTGYGAPGSISQSILLDAGTYTLSWFDGGRKDGGNSNLSYVVSLGANTIYSGAVTSMQSFKAVTAAPITLAAGTYNLKFQAINSGGDSMALLDNVVLSSAAVPEPATWAMMFMGFGAVGYSMRSRRKLVISAI